MNKTKTHKKHKWIQKNCDLKTRNWSCAKQMSLQLLGHKCCKYQSTLALASSLAFWWKWSGNLWTLFCFLPKPIEPKYEKWNRIQAVIRKEGKTEVVWKNTPVIRAYFVNIKDPLVLALASSLAFWWKWSGKCVNSEVIWRRSARAAPRVSLSLSRAHTRRSRGWGADLSQITSFITIKICKVIIFFK